MNNFFRRGRIECAICFGIINLRNCSNLECGRKLRTNFLMTSCESGNKSCPLSCESGNKSCPLSCESGNKSCPLYRRNILPQQHNSNPTKEELKNLSMLEKITRLERILESNITSAEERRDLSEFILHLKLICTRIDFEDFYNHCVKYGNKYPLAHEPRLILLQLLAEMWLEMWLK
jgi:hypothetical protein